VLVAMWAAACFGGAAFFGFCQLPDRQAGLTRIY
jgi:hypothetical protein